MIEAVTTMSAMGLCLGVILGMAARRFHVEGDPVIDELEKLMPGTNCAVLGVALLNVQEAFSFAGSLLYGFGSALGFTLVLVIFAGQRERLARNDVPAPFRGAPIAFITAGLLSMAFMGFAGLAAS